MCPVSEMVCIIQKACSLFDDLLTIQFWSSRQPHNLMTPIDGADTPSFWSLDRRDYKHCFIAGETVELLWQQQMNECCNKSCRRVMLICLIKMLFSQIFVDCFFYGTVCFSGKKNVYFTLYIHIRDCQLHMSAAVHSQHAIPQLHMLLYIARNCLCEQKMSLI